MTVKRDIHFLVLAFLAILFSRQYFTLFYAYTAFVLFLLWQNRGLFRGNNHLLQIYLAGYPTLLLIAASIHYYALAELPFLSYISIDQVTTLEGMHWAKQELFRYLAFPLFFFAQYILFTQSKNPLGLIQKLPLLFLPSLFMGLYQEFVNPDFLNSHPFHSVASGLSFDASAYGIMMLPLILITAYSLYSRPIRSLSFWINLLMFFLLLFGLLLRGQKTSLICLTVFPFLLPFCIFLLTRRRGYFMIRLAPIYLCPVLLFSALLLLNHYNKLPDLKGFHQLRGVTSKTLKTGYAGFVHEMAATRTGLWQTALAVIGEAPLAGLGPGGFWRSMKNYETKYDTLSVPKESAGNHYLHMTTEIGIIGLFMGLLPFFSCLTRKNYTLQAPSRIFLFSTTLTLVISFISGAHMNSPDVAFVYASFPALILAGSEEWSFPPLSKEISWLLVLLLLSLFTWQTYTFSLGDKGYRALRNSAWFPDKYRSEQGFYRWENWAGIATRWMHKRGRFSRKVTQPYVSFTLTFPPFPAQVFPEGIHLEMAIADIPVANLHGDTFATFSCNYDLSRFLDKKVTFALETNVTYNPSQYSESTDSRQLGVAMSKLSFSAEDPARFEQEANGINAWSTTSLPGHCVQIKHQ